MGKHMHARAGQQGGQEFIVEALPDTLAGALFFEDDAAFFVDFLVGQEHAEGKIGQTEEPFVERVRFGVRQGQEIRRLVETGKGILMLAKRRPMDSKNLTRRQGNVAYR
jgi:hypothetical protein